MTTRNTGVRSRQPLSRLAPSDVPGVYRNRQGVLVDENGVKVTFKDVKAADTAQLERAVHGADHEPAFLLRAWSNDPTLPRAVRMDAAKAAAPYYSPRLANVTAAVRVTPTQVDYASMSPAQLEEAMLAIDKLMQLQIAPKDVDG